MSAEHEAKRAISNISSAVSDAAEKAGDYAHDAAAKAGELASDAAAKAQDLAGDAAAKAEGTLTRAGHIAQDTLHKASSYAQDAARQVKDRASDTLDHSREYVRENPVPVVLGALALGVFVGYLISRRESAPLTFRERYVDEPFGNAKDALYEVLAPVAQKLHSQYDTAKSSAEDVLDHLRPARRAANHWFNDVRRFGSNLKFW